MNIKSTLTVIFALFVISVSTGQVIDPPQKDISSEPAQALKSKMLDAMGRHLNLLLATDGSVRSLSVGVKRVRRL